MFPLKRRFAWALGAVGIIIAVAGIGAAVALRTHNLMPLVGIGILSVLVAGWALCRAATAGEDARDVPAARAVLAVALCAIATTAVVAAVLL